MRRAVRRKAKGSILVESVVSIALILPFLALSVLVALEASQAFVISRGMTEAAVLACRALSNEFMVNKKIVSDTSRQQYLFSNVRIANLVHDNSQFKIESWSLSEAPRTVTVRVTYIPGAGNSPLAAFPSNGSLNLGSIYRISQSVTYRLKE